MRIDALASGSSGNAYLLRSESATVLLEAGLPASRLAALLKGFGVGPSGLDAIVLTHAHSDHARGARSLSERYRAPIYATAGTLGHRELRACENGRVVEDGRMFEIGDLEILPFAVPHDCAEPVGYRLRGPRATVALTTDLGFVPDELPARLEGADLVILEANHDEEMLWSGPYHPALKARVGGNRGHLSNGAAARCVERLQRRPPDEVWLAHLSLVNNRVGTALAVVRQALDAVGLTDVGLRAVARNRPSLRWSAGQRVRQLRLF